MAITLTEPTVEELPEVLEALREWHRDGAPFQLHPGDVGWFWRFGDETTAAALRTWCRDGELLGIGLLDGPDLLRLAFAPDLGADEQLARQLVADVTAPERGVLPAGEAAVESPPGALVADLLGEAGWSEAEPWALLRRDLTEPVEEQRTVRIEAIGPERAPAWVAVHRAAFGSSLSAEAVLQRWQTMAAGAPYADARSLLAFDGADPVAAAVVWSAGTGRYGLLEPLGVHPEHRGRGHGRAITLAAATALRELGCSAALVCTASANVGAVATYVSAGFRQLPERVDMRREASL